MWTVLKFRRDLKFLTHKNLQYQKTYNINECLSQDSNEQERTTQDRFVNVNFFCSQASERSTLDIFRNGLEDHISYVSRRWIVGKKHRLLTIYINNLS